MPDTIKVMALNEDAIVPIYGTDGSAGMDLHSTEDVLITPTASEVVPLGVAVEIPKGYVGLLTHRSSLAFKADSVCSLGIIDSDYRGEIKAKFFNLGNDGLYIKKGDRVAQLVVVPCLTGFEVVHKLGDTDRGEGGFGSTGPC